MQLSEKTAEFYPQIDIVIARCGVQQKGVFCTAEDPGTG